MRRNFVKVEWDEASRRIVCYPPLTSPTGKVRVKRNGKPLATRQEIFTENDEIEWQIAYRDQTGQFVELGQILWLGRKHGVIGDEALIGHLVTTL
ncbi:MAG: hypothetical protein ACUVTP_07985 [Candidatus Fervidibacter sp.]|uniref:hypothetical protein n=1 Tax=Candidatus Fervidibacter sp. TaxID=3100871 RepID=UPI00404ABF59